MGLATKIQMAIHRHYDNIKLALQFVIIALIITMMVNANALTDRVTNDNRESAAEIVERIDRETQEQTEEITRQTEQLNQQFQALCFIIVQIAGEDALRQIDPPLEEQCKALVQEMRDDAAQTPQAQANNAPVPSGQRTEPVEPRSGSQVQPDPPTPPRPTPAPTQPPAVEPEPPRQSWLLNGVDNLLNGLGL